MALYLLPVSLVSPPWFVIGLDLVSRLSSFRGVIELR
jgi:hypothetical protein